MVLCATKQYLQDHPINTSQDLINQQWLLYKSDNNTINIKNNNDKQTQKITVTPHMVSNNTQILKHACLKGLGIACLPKISVKQHIQNNTLIPLLENHQIQHNKDVYMVYPSNKYMSVKMKEFIKFIKQQANQLSM